jgi:3-(3-hydroxy-phenyl)propionate hydroxylase
MFRKESAAYDIVIIGAGPVGLTAANLALAHGLSVVVIEKEARPFPLPRAIHFNGDVLRIFQSAGLTDMLRPQIGIQRGTTIFGADGQPNVRLSFQEDESTGWRTQYSFYQPILEATLRDNLRERSGIQVRYACEAVRLDQDRSGVTLHTSSPTGHSEIFAHYLIACDGARSFTRSSLEIAMETLGPSEDWIVVDVFFDERNPLPPDRSLIYSNPDQPAVYVPGPGMHRRFEWQLAPQEDPELANTLDNIVRVLARWTDPDQLEILRHAAYTFRARIAEKWRSGSVFLAGDAAHQTPPFLGQGMGHGVRDVASLVWKIARVRRGADPALLDTYQMERAPHVRTVINRAIEVGRRMGVRDPAEATSRDLAMRSAGPLDRPDTNKLMPPLTSGFIGRGKAAGSAFPQPWVNVKGGRPIRLDDVIGTRSAVISRCELHPSITRQLLAEKEICWLTLAPIAGVEGCLALHEATGVSAWLNAIGADVVIVRPDRYVYDHSAEAGAGEIILSYLAMIGPIETERAK